MSFNANIYFKVGVATINETTSISINDELIQVEPGFVFTLKLYEDGKFRLKTTWHVEQADSKQPDFKKETMRLIQEHKEILVEAFKNTRIRLS